MAKIVVTRRIHPDALAQLREWGSVQLWDGDGPIPRPVLRDWIHDADACLSMLTDRIDPPLLAHAPQLRIVSNMAVGFDNIDIDAASRHRVMVSNTPDVLTESTAELTWTLMLALARDLLPAHQALMDGRWRVWQPDGFLGTELYGKTLGIAGLGRIGQAVARRAPAFGMRVVALETPRPSTARDIPRLPHDRFLPAVDVLSLHMPLTEATRHVVDTAWFKQMKPSAYLVNTARGGVIDEIALKAALDQGRLAGAALDVFDSEPVDGSHPLAHHPRVLATPHIGSATHETRHAMAMRAAHNIGAALHGQPPPDWLNRTFAPRPAPH